MAVLNRVGNCGLVDRSVQGRHDIGGRSFRREDTDPKIVFDVVAELLQGRHIRQRLRALAAERRQRTQLAAFDMLQSGGDTFACSSARCCRAGRSPPVRRRSSAGGEASGCQLLFQQRDRQMGRAIEPARTVDDGLRALFGVVDQILEGLVRLLFIDDHENRVGDQPRQRNEIGACGFRLAAPKSLSTSS